MLAGILLYETGAAVFPAVFVTAAFLYFILKVKSGKMHYLYLIFPIITIISFMMRKSFDSESLFLENLKADGGKILCQLEGSVDLVKESSNGYKIFLQDVTVTLDGTECRTENCIVYSEDKYLKRDRLKISGKAAAFKSASNPGEFDLEKYYATLKIKYAVYASRITKSAGSDVFIYSLADRISDKADNILHNITDTATASVFGAMILGRRESIDTDMSDLFTACGIGHILAISGLHISLLGMGLYKLLRRCGAGDVASMAGGAAFIIFYGLMTGGGVSQTRALIMFITAVYANVANRSYDMMSGASLSAVIMLADCPYLVHNSGFQLSFAAVFGITCISSTLCKAFDSRNKILNSLLSGIGIQLATIPLIMYYYYRIPVLSVLLNMIVVPLMTIVMISGISGIIAGSINTAFGTIAIGPGAMILKLYEKMCEGNLKINGSVYTCGQPAAWRIIVYYIVLGFIIYYISQKPHRLKTLLALIPLIFILIKPRPHFEMDFLDVGQGDGIFIRMEDGTTILVDSGSTDNSRLYEYTLEPFLLSRGVDELDYVIVTHCDNDHISALKALLNESVIHVTNFCMPSTTCIDDAYEDLWELASESASNIMEIYAGMCIQTADGTVTCIHPSYQYKCDDRNDYSTTLVVQYGEFTALLTGDISSEQEKEILPYVQPYAPFDLLKAAHHGSKYSSCTEFLDEVSPLACIISCGIDNSYGHPHTETMDRINAAGSEIYRTDEIGAVLVNLRDGKVNINGYR